MPRISASNAAWVATTLISMSWEFTFYGVFAAIVITTSWILIQKGLRDSRARRWLFLINVVMFGISTAHVVIMEKFYLLQYPTLTSDLVDDNPEWMVVQLNKWRIAMMVLRRVSYLISDAVVVWRTWCIWQDNVWVRLYLGILLFATAATSIFTAIASGIPLHLNGRITNLTGSLPLLVTNFSTILLCGYKVWEYRRFVRAAFKGRRHNSLVENVLLILVESGSLYVIFWLLFMLGDFGYFATGPFGPAFGLEWFMPHFAGIYTSLIILVVALSRTASDTFCSAIEYDLQTHNLVGNTEKNQLDVMRFAPAPAPGSTFATVELGMSDSSAGTGTDTDTRRDSNDLPRRSESQEDRSSTSSRRSSS